MKAIHISIAQMTCIDGKVEQNLSNAYDMVDEAGKNGALFPFLLQSRNLSAF